MSDDKKNKNFEGLGELLDHDYDGIQELDNPLPGWWLLTFYGTMIFAALYFAFYQLGGGPTSDDELKASLAAVGSKIEESKELSNQVNWDELAKDPKTMELGKSVFMGKCGSCHGMSGEGLIGPNLTDKFWIHGDGTSAAIHKVILEGVLEKGMPAWQAQLKPEESDAVTVYIRSLRGTQPANPKAPQGTEVL